jgi:hypothetical protein
MSIQTLNILNTESLPISPIPKIDKITITRPMVPSSLQFTSEKVVELLHLNIIPNLRVKSDSLYRINATFSAPFGALSRNTVLFQAGGYGQYENYYRLEFNPNNVGYAGFIDIQDFLSRVLCEGDAAAFLLFGRTTRLDIAIDIPGLPLSDAIVRLKRARKHGVYTGPKGLPETVYLGGARSSRAVVYEKEIPFADQPSLRIERRLKPGISVSKLSSLLNPFKNVIVIPTSHLRSLTTDIHPDILFDSMRVRGIMRSLKFLSPQQQRILKAALNDPAHSLMPSADDVWAKWPNTLQSVGLLFPD